MAEISVPAWPIPIHQTKFVIGNAHATGYIVAEDADARREETPSPRPETPSTATSAMQNVQNQNDGTSVGITIDVICSVTL